MSEVKISGVRHNWTSLPGSQLGRWSSIRFGVSSRWSCGSFQLHVHMLRSEHDQMSNSYVLLDDFGTMPTMRMLRKKQFGWLWDDLNEEVINKTAQNPQLTAEVWLKQWSLAQQKGPGDSTTWTGTSGWGNPARKRFIYSIKRRFKLDLLQTRFFQRLSRTECIRVSTGLESTRLPGISEMHCSLHLFAVWFPALMAGLPSWHLRKEGWMRFRCVQLSLWWKKCVTLNLHMKFKELFRCAFSPKTQSPLTTHLKGAQVETGWRWSLITNGSQERKWKLISPFSNEQWSQRSQWSQRPQNWRLILLALESQRSCCLSQG